MSCTAINDCDSGRYWAVLKTKPTRENYVQYQLRDLGIETYFPLLKIFKKDLHKSQRQIEPFFPGYILARLDPGGDLFRVRGVRGVTSVVSFGGQPARLDPRVIEDFRLRENGKGYICVHRTKPEFQWRDPIQIVSGPFAGYRGLFGRYLDSRLRVCVLLDILKPQTPVELPLSSVSATVPAWV